jgi:hypothetical protein
MNTQSLQSEIAAFEKMKGDLLERYREKYVIIKDQQLKGSFDTFDAAAREAIKHFGRGPYLIRKVSEEPVMPMPASVAYRPVHAPY